MNTNAENPASSNTGATNQPLITVGMLERLNGNEKGDAIVSVRGYEPIWTRFTPSYELKGIYFKEGKADIGKREAVLFDKQNYVFDIVGENGQSEEDRILDEIEKQEQEAEPNGEVEENRLADLDKAWEKIVNEINAKIEQLAILFNGRDRRAVKQARLEDKATVLYALMEDYDQSTAQKMQDLADYISGQALPELKQLQTCATK